MGNVVEEYDGECKSTTISNASGYPTTTSVSSFEGAVALEDLLTASPGGVDPSSLNSAPEAVAQTLSTVWLHVYDKGPLTGHVNGLILRRANLGLFHYGVDIFGVEWSFQAFHGAWDDPTISGVVWNEPRRHPSFLYRESVALGHTPLCREAVSKVLDRLRREWSATSYHLVSNNCLKFAEEFASALEVTGLLPAWVHGATEACRVPCVGAFANCFWRCCKWWSQRRTRPDDIVQTRMVADAYAMRRV